MVQKFQGKRYDGLYPANYHSEFESFQPFLSRALKVPKNGNDFETCV